jgi:hypothetical protein
VERFGQTFVTDEPANDVHPTWSPDGQRLAFASYRNGPTEIFIVDQDGGGLVKLTDGLDPSWSSGSGSTFPLFGPLVFSDAFDQLTGQPANVSASFPYGTREIHALWTFQDIPPGTTIRYDWYLDGVPLFGGEDTLNDASGRARQWIHSQDGSPLMPGIYQFAVRTNEGIVLSEQCTVLQPGQTGDVVPPPPVGGPGCEVTLQEPDSGSEFGPTTQTVNLRWQLNRPLAADEYFFVNVPYPHQGTTWYDGTWRDPSRQLLDGTRESSWTLREYLCAPGFSDTGEYSWYVEVRQMRGPEPSLSDPIRCRSETRTFRWEGCYATPTPVIQAVNPYY